MKKAFTYMFDDEFFKVKAGIFYVFLALATYCSIFLLCDSRNEYSMGRNAFVIVSAINFLLNYCLIWGYLISVIRAKEQITSAENLPVISLKRDLLSGIKYMFAYFLYILPLQLIIMALCFNTGLSVGIGSQTYFNVSLALSVICAILIWLWIVFIMPASTLVFSKTNSVWSFYKFEEVFKIISDNKKRYFASAMMFFLFCFLVGIFNILISILCIKYHYEYICLFLISAVLYVYLSYVISYIIANLGNKE